MKIKLDPFIIALGLVIFLAYLFPQYGSKNSLLPLDTISSLGVILIFFFYGLKLSPDKIKTGLNNWKLHAIIQATTFLIFPLLVIAFRPFIETPPQEKIWLAFLFLSALPSTVSSSVVMVSIAKGNVAGAIFNASISGIIGILVTPLWMGIFLQQIGSSFDFSEIYLKLFLGVIAPVLLGFLLQKIGHQFAIKYAKSLSLFDKTVILLIVYKSFCESFEANLFSNIEPLDFGLILLLVVALFFTVWFFTTWISKILKFTQEDQITTQFCGTKKSLVHGSVFYKILFQNNPSSGLILLPIMIFHAFQLVVISLIATKYEQEKAGKN